MRDKLHPRDLKRNVARDVSTFFSGMHPTSHRSVGFSVAHNVKLFQRVCVFFFVRPDDASYPQKSVTQQWSRHAPTLSFVIGPFCLTNLGPDIGLGGHKQHKRLKPANGKWFSVNITSNASKREKCRVGRKRNKKYDVHLFRVINERHHAKYYFPISTEAEALNVD